MESKLAGSQHELVQIERRLQNYLEDLTVQKHDREKMKCMIDELRQTVADGDRDHAKLLEDINSMQTANKQLQFDLHVSHFNTFFLTFVLYVSLYSVQCIKIVRLYQDEVNSR